MNVPNVLFGVGDVWANLIQARQRAASSAVTIARPTAEAVKDQIGAATRLDKASKQSLNTLTATVDKYASGNPALMRSILGIANLMQIGAKEDTNSSALAPFAKVLEAYYQPKMAANTVKLDA